MSSLSPAEHRRHISRQRSSPSLAIGLPPPLPESNIMSPSTSTKTLKRSRSRHRVHRGDVSSSAASSPCASDDDDARTEMLARIMPVETTPRRKIVGAMESSTIGRIKPGTKLNSLQTKLESVAKVRKTRSTGDGLSADVTRSPLLVKTKITAKTSHATLTTDSSDKSDKVVVCVRVKPTTSPFASTAYELSPSSLTLSDSHPNVLKRGGKAGREGEYAYTFDKLLQYPSKTPDLYLSKVAPLVEKAMHGFNSTIFAYGQTGSGKSFTMTGTSTEIGIIPCAVDGVFDAINAEPDRAYLLRVSYIEIYNETVRDLLNFKKGPLKDEEKPAVHTTKGKVYVDPLVEEVVSTPQDIVALLEKGNISRKTGATDWNERSSRSHSVFTIVIESKPREGNGDDDVRLSRLNLIDLAGSEKAVSDLERRGEGKHINRSLFALREVINKLTDKKRAHIPYRDSKLTHILENALGGDSNICVICTMSAEEEHTAETLETLKFAGRCSQVETKAKKNVLLSNERALIRAKDKEIAELKQKLVGLTEGSGIIAAQQDSMEMIDLADSVASMEARKSKLSAQLAKLNAEILTSEFPRSAAGLPVISPRPKRRRISDFSNPLGLGTPKRVIVNDRRAVSSMVRVTEEVDAPSMITVLETDMESDASKAFDHDLTIAALRRSLAVKEGGLESANRELSVATFQLAQLPEREAEVSDLTTSLQSLQTEHAALQRLHAKSGAEHDNKLREYHTQLESTRAELVVTINSKTAKIDQLENAIMELRKSREELMIEDQNQHDDTKRELETALMNVDKAKSELGLVQAALDKEQQASQNAVQELDMLQTSSKVDTDCLTSELYILKKCQAEMQSQLDSSQAAHKEVVGQLETSRSETEDAVKARHTAVKDLEQYQRKAMSTEAQIVTELRDEIAKLRQARDDDSAKAEKELQSWRSALEAEKASMQRLRGQLRTEREKNTQLERGERQLQETLDARQREKEAAAQALQEERARRQAAELTINDAESTMAGLVGRNSTLDMDCAALRHALASAQAEVEDAKRKAILSTEKATDLAKKVVELRAATVAASTSVGSHRTRHTVSTSDPSIPSADVMDTLRVQALQVANTGPQQHSPAAKLMTKERAEIVKLEKVVEAQKAMIDDQRERIKFWATELEQQRDIVKVLTQDPGTGTPPKFKVTHGRPETLDSSPRTDAYPATNTKRTTLRSTFTAFNLALPTTPTPLPAHPSQFSNSSSKRGRRITIEHDMDKLSESSKVNLARAVFDQPGAQPRSPTKLVLLPGGGMMGGAPKQRRP